MLTDVDLLVSDFATAADQLDLEAWPSKLSFEVLRAPHNPPSLRRGHGAVDAFALARHSVAPAGAGTVLKVGRVGVNSNPRFQSQHYGLNARSTLARSILGHPVLWPWLGIDHSDGASVKAWMLANLDRMHVFVPAAAAVTVLPVLEMYVRARIGSVFEGST